MNPLDMNKIGKDNLTFLRRTISLLSSMIIGNERHTSRSRDMVNNALSLISELNNEDDGWIKVSERIPPPQKRVLAWTGFKMMEVAWEEPTDMDEAWFRKMVIAWRSDIKPPSKIIKN